MIRSKPAQRLSLGLLGLAALAYTLTATPPATAQTPPKPQYATTQAQTARTPQQSAATGIYTWPVLGISEAVDFWDFCIEDFVICNHLDTSYRTRDGHFGLSVGLYTYGDDSSSLPSADRRVIAPASGIIDSILEGSGGERSLIVIVDDQNGYLLGHMDANKIYASKNQRVERGQLLGEYKANAFQVDFTPLRKNLTNPNMPDWISVPIYRRLSRPISLDVFTWNNSLWKDDKGRENCPHSPFNFGRYPLNGECIFDRAEVFEFRQLLPVSLRQATFNR